MKAGLGSFHVITNCKMSWFLSFYVSCGLQRFCGQLCVCSITTSHSVMNQYHPHPFFLLDWAVLGFVLVLKMPQCLLFLAWLSGLVRSQRPLSGIDAPELGNRKWWVFPFISDHLGDAHCLGFSFLQWCVGWHFWQILQWLPCSSSGQLCWHHTYCYLTVPNISLDTCQCWIPSTSSANSVSPWPLPAVPPGIIG